MWSLWNHLIIHRSNFFPENSLNFISDLFEALLYMFLLCSWLLLNIFSMFFKQFFSEFYLLLQILFSDFLKSHIPLQLLFIFNIYTRLWSIGTIIIGIICGRMIHLSRSINCPLSSGQLAIWCIVQWAWRLFIL